MRKSRQIEILRTFSKKEIREFRKWIVSPAHNQRQDVISLFNYLLNEKNLRNDDLLGKELIFSQLFKQEPYDDARMRQTIYFSSKILEGFLIHQEISKDDLSTRIKLLKTYRNRNLDKALLKTTSQIESLLEAHPYRDEDYWRNRYMLQAEKYAFAVSQKRAIPFNLQEISDTLDAAFIAEKLRQSCLMLAHKTVFKTEFTIGLIEETLKYTETNNFLQHPAIAIYYYLYKTNTDKENESYFEALKKEITKSGHLFNREEIKWIYLGTVNYTIGKINTGKTKFIREAFDLYRQGFEKKILIDYDPSFRFLFRNVISIALKLKEYDWVENFIEENQKYLDDKHHESFVNFNLAKLYFERKQYDKSMYLLNTTDFNDILISLSARSMLVKMFYEQDETEPLISQLESLRNYMQRKKVIGYHKENYKNFIKFTKRLLKVAPYSETKKEQLLAEVVTANPLTERDWLVEMIGRV